MSGYCQCCEMCGVSCDPVRYPCETIPYLGVVVVTPCHSAAMPLSTQRTATMNSPMNATMNNVLQFLFSVFCFLFSVFCFLFFVDASFRCVKRPLCLSPREHIQSCCFVVIAPWTDCHNNYRYRNCVNNQQWTMDTYPAKVPMAYLVTISKQALCLEVG